MRALDAAACATFTDVALMRRAGRAIAAVVRTQYAKGRVVGLAGGGNNGGDALDALAELDASTYERIALVFNPGEKASNARRDAERRAREAGVAILPVDEENIEQATASPAFFLDGLLGVGARSDMHASIRAVTRAVNARAHGAVLAIDVPTGLNGTTGVAEDDAIVARATVCIGALKLGLLLEHARPYVGKLWFDDIGMDDKAFDAHASSEYVTLDETSAAALLPARPFDADKRTAGAPLIIAGSKQFPGAAVLSARAASRAGAGYVAVATPRNAAASLRAHLVEQIVIAFEDDDPQHAVDDILDAGKRYGAIGIGPGLGLSDNMGKIVRGVILGSTVPMAIDASAFFHLAKHLDILRGKSVVLTPHAGEFARLSGTGSCTSQERLTRLRAFVRERGVTTLLKGQTTLVDDGTRVYVNTTGTQALATAGTGDVLTGMIATLLAQGMQPFEAASLAAYWHGRAARIAAAQRPIGVVASDVLDVLAKAIPHAAPPMPMRIF
jgi:hydroxyethylthiazole kinase-like uncharacterized protein yjeF